MKKIFILLCLTTLVIIASVKTSESNEKQFNCLVEAIYFEARSESFLGQLAVANVVLNRVSHNNFPNKICSVVHQGYYINNKPIRNKCMFSYWCDGKPEKIKNMEAYVIAENVALLALQKVVIQRILGATHYHANYVSPSWSKHKNFKRLAQLGKHIFYIEKN